MSKCLIAALQFFRERNVLNAAFFVVCQRGIRDGLERLCATGTEVKDAGNTVFQEPQVYCRNIADIDEITFEVFTAFEQLGCFAVVKLSIEMESYARHAAFVTFTWPVDVEVTEANDLRICFWQDLAYIFVEQEF